MNDRPPRTEPEVRSSSGNACWRPAATPLGFWALLLGVLAGVQAGFGGDLLPVLVQGGSAAVVALIAVVIVLATRIERRRVAGLRTVPDLSMASALAAVSLAAMLSGVGVGGWLIIGGGLGLAAALGGLAREWRAERRSRDAAAATRSDREARGGVM